MDNDISTLGIYRCLVFDENVTLRELLAVKNKALHSKRLSINVRHQVSSLIEFLLNDAAKIIHKIPNCKHFPENLSFLSKKMEKSLGQWIILLNFALVIIKERIMDANGISRYSVDVPKSDITLFRNMTKRMGWNIKKQSQNEFNEATLLALKEVREGKTFKASSVEDLIAQLND